MGLFKRQNGGAKTLTSRDEMVRLITGTFTKMGTKYEFDEKECVFSLSGMGDDLPIHVIIKLDEATMHMASPLHLKAEEINYKDVVWELNSINSGLVFGAFSLNAESGFIIFQYGLPYCETKVTPEYFTAFLKMVFETVDAYDGKLKSIAEKVTRSEYEAMYM